MCRRPWWLAIGGELLLPHAPWGGELLLLPTPWEGDPLVHQPHREGTGCLATRLDETKEALCGHPEA
ncbi:MAG: hypothetical protein ACK587_09815 [Cyanobacteriota bacterium]